MSDLPLHSVSDFWRQHPVPTEGCLAVRLGPLRVWVWRTPGAWCVAHHVGEADGGDAEVLPCPLPSGLPPPSRTAHNNGHEGVRLVPRVPDRPLVVRPSGLLRVAPGHSAAFYVSIPLHVEILLPGQGGTPPLTLAELPVQFLSKTWFGAPDDDAGLLCYALRTRAVQRVDEAPADRPGYAVCSLEVHNQSPEPFVFERLCLQTAPLAVHLGPEGRLWTNAVRATHRGSTESARLTYSDGAPAAAHPAHRLTPPRDSSAAALSTRVFGTLRHALATA